MALLPRGHGHLKPIELGVQFDLTAQATAGSGVRLLLDDIPFIILGHPSLGQPRLGYMDMARAAGTNSAAITLNTGNVMVTSNLQQSSGGMISHDALPIGGMENDGGHDLRAWTNI
jgi:hypothetical protein